MSPNKCNEHEASANKRETHKQCDESQWAWMNANEPKQAQKSVNMHKKVQMKPNEQAQIGRQSWMSTNVQTNEHKW